MYAVAVLAEQPLSALDATQVASLHEALDEPVRYHLLVADADRAVDGAKLLQQQGHEAAAESLGGAGPVDALVELAGRVGAAEVIVLTASHPVREALHRDWTSAVRRRTDLPTLHLLEHETFDEQSAGLGEGNQML